MFIYLYFLWNLGWKKVSKKKLNTFFENFLQKDSLFQDKKTLQSNHTPEALLHREDQMHQIANVLAPSLKQEKASNLFLYGKTGTGKTLTTKYTLIQLEEVAQKAKVPLKTIYINCKLKRSADTEYRLIAELCRSFGKAIPPTGLPTQEVYDKFHKALKHHKTTTIIILDEIDQLVKKTGDNILYSLIRINEEIKEGQLSVIGISNDLTFIDNIDPRVRSSLSEEEIIFSPYNAFQLQNILKQRCKGAFKEDSLAPGVIEKCAAYAAREHGDARRALELIRVAGELAERENNQKVTINHLDKAEEKIDRDRFTDTVATQPKQHQLTLYAVLSLNPGKNSHLFTGEVYTLYKELCAKQGLRPLTQRRVSDIIAEFDMLGFIHARVISKGRYGRTREISIAIPTPLRVKIKDQLRDQLSL